MKRHHSTLIVACMMSVGLAPAAHAQEEPSRFAIPLSLSVGIGTMKNDDANVQSRTMNALSIEALPSYRWGAWLLGPHLDYRMQGQNTKKEDVGGSNLRGQGYLIGLGARHDFNERLFAQASVDFFGQYDLKEESATNQDVNMKSPIGLRLKAGYAFLPSIPNLTFDADLQYLTYSKISSGGNEVSQKTEQLMASVGITYLFGFNKKSAHTEEPPAPAKVEAPTPPPAAAHREELAQSEGVQKVGDSLLVNMTGASFSAGSTKLSPSAKSQFAKTAQMIAKTDSKVRVEGYTDSSGNAKRNEALSLARAEAVKLFLVEQGVRSENVSTQGFGSAKPVADNKTKDGRAKNRRVEIYID